jgi:hypothetical protein
MRQQIAPKRCVYQRTRRRMPEDKSSCIGIVHCSVSQPWFCRISSGVSEKSWNKYIGILKYSETFQMFLEIWTKFCPAIGSTGIISVRYQLPLCFLACKRFRREGFLVNWKIVWNKSWETLDYWLVRTWFDYRHGAPVEWNCKRVKPKYSGKKLSQCHFVHHKSHMDWPGIETGPPRWEAGD